MKRIFSFLIALLLVASTAGASDFSNFNFNFDWSPSGNSVAAFYSPFTTTLSVLTPPRAYPGTTGTFTRASAQYLVNDSNELTQFASGVPATNSKGILLEPASTNKVTAYGIIPADTLGSELVTPYDFTSGWTPVAGYVSSTQNTITTSASGGLTKSFTTLGKVYQVTISASSTAESWGLYDYDSTTLITTSSGTFTFTATRGVNLYLRNVGAGVLTVTAFSVKEVGWAVGTKSYYTGSAFRQNITGLTLSGDTAAVLSIVTDQTEITNAGLADINPTYKVYKLDNSAGSGWAYLQVSGQVGNINAHTLSTYIRGGSGLIAYSDGGNSLNFTGTATYGRITKENVIPSSTARTFLFGVGAGQTIYIILPQLEETTAATSYIPTAGATATRAATSLSYPTSAWGIPMSIKWLYTPSANKTGDEYLLGSYLDANNSTSVFVTNGTTITFRKRVSGVNHDATYTLGSAMTLGTTYPMGARLNADYTTDIFVNHLKGTGSSDTTVPAQTTNFKLGDDGNGGSGLLSGQIKDLKIYKKRLPDSLMYLDWKYRSADSYFMEVAA